MAGLLTVSQTSAETGAGRVVTTLEGLTARSAASTAVVLHLYGEQLRVDYEVNDHVVEQETLPAVPASESIPIELPGATQLPETVRLPSGNEYEAPGPLGDGHNRRYGEEDIYRLPGINNEDDIQEVLRAPNAVEEYGPYTYVEGNNPNRPGGIGLWLFNGVLVAGTYSYGDYRGEQVAFENIVEKNINDRHNWDHNIIGDSRAEIVRNLLRVIQNPDEVYEKNPEEGIGVGDSFTRIYLRELIIDGNEVIVQVIVTMEEGELSIVSAYVPVRDAPAGSDYEDIYDRDDVLSYIRGELEEGVEKVYEGSELIEVYDEGDIVR